MYHCHHPVCLKIILLASLQTSILLRIENEILREQCRRVEQSNRNLLTLSRCHGQIIEALSDKNRWYASQNLGRPATENEAVLHYIQCGGKTHYDEIHPSFG